jgi:hypothetical protein
VNIPNFPMRFVGVYAYLATVANGGLVTSDTGVDIWFTSDMAGSNILPFERVTYVPTTGAVEFFVNLPILYVTDSDDSQDTVCYIWYGESGAPDLSNTAGTWSSDYAAVYHFGDGTAVDLTDSTVNGNDGSNDGCTNTTGLLSDNTSNTTGSGVGGALAVQFSQTVNFGNGASFQDIDGSAGYVAIAIVSVGSNTDNNLTDNRLIFGNEGSDGDGGFCFYQWANGNGNGSGIAYPGLSGAGTSYGSSFNMLNNGVSAYFMLFDPTRSLIVGEGMQQNGVPWGPETTGLGPNYAGPSIDDFVIASNSYTVLNNFYPNIPQASTWFEGTIDELRILNTSANYPYQSIGAVSEYSRVRIECNNLLQTETYPFYVIGDESFVSDLSVSCNNPPGGYVGIFYTHTFLALAGVSPYTFSISAGSLPTGVTLDDSTGIASGTPTTADTYDFTVEVTDSMSDTATVDCSITISTVETLTINCGNPPGGVIGQAYNSAVMAAGGVEPYTFSISAGSLPTGLFLNPSTGAITGTPATTGTFTYTVEVTDSISDTAQVPCQIVVVGFGNVILYEWAPSYLPKREVTLARVTDYTDCGYKGLKWMQGRRIHANTFQGSRNILIQYDGGQTGPSIIVTHPGEQIKPYSWPPFLAHYVRMVPVDIAPADWVLWDDGDWVFTPVPENVQYWVARPTSFGIQGFFHIRDAIFAYAGAGTFTILMDTGETFSFDLPATAAGVENKLYFPVNPLKGKLATLSAVGNPDLQVYVEDIEVRVKQWGSSGPWQIARLIGDQSQVAARI